MKTINLFVCSLISVYSFAQSPLIVGGGAVSDNEYPWVVELIDDNGGSYEHICGASLIAADWVLTAGHCGEGLPGFIDPPNKVIINSIHIQNGSDFSEEIAIDTIIIHPNFDLNIPDNGMDIALIKLSSPSSMSTIDYHTLAEDSSLIEVNDMARVLGWGHTGLSTSSDSLKASDPYIISVANGIITAGYSADQTPGGAGAGDSGGPLIVDKNGSWLQVGIVSSGDGQFTEPGSPGYYTHIYSQLEWIENVIASFSEPVGLQELDKESFSIVTGKNYLEISPTKHLLSNNFNYILSDVLGRKIQEGDLQNETKTIIPLKNNANKIMLLTILSNNGIEQVSKIGQY